MALATMMGLIDDAARPIMRLLGYNHAVKTGRTYYEPFEGMVGKSLGLNRLAQREKNLMGAGRSGLIFGRPMKGLGVGLGHLKGLEYFAAGAAILGGYTAPRRHKMSGMVGGVARTAAYAIGDVVGTAIGGPLAGFILGSIVEPLGGKVGEAFQAFADINRNIKHINMGGDYEDTKVAYTMRQRAAQEMGSSVMNARTWLGREAALMHQ